MYIVHSIYVLASFLKKQLYACSTYDDKDPLSKYSFPL